VSGTPVPPEDLPARLRSALDEAERIASAVILNDHEPWWTGDDLGAHVDEHDSAFIVANGPAVVLRTIQAHRKIVERYETAVVSRDAAVGTLLAGATRMSLRIHEETLQLIAAIYLPDIETGDTA
jgi:hypothetical protein